jgi:hypothetical protein
MRVFAQAISFASRCVVHEDKISWPTRGPNVGWTIGSTMRCRPASLKSLQMWLFRGVRRRASWRPTRPVTRRSRVRVPSLPSPKAPANRRLALSG